MPKEKRRKHKPSSLLILLVTMADGCSQASAAAAAATTSFHSAAPAARAYVSSTAQSQQRISNRPWEELNSTEECGSPMLCCCSLAFHNLPRGSTRHPLSLVYVCFCLLSGFVSSLSSSASAGLRCPSLKTAFSVEFVRGPSASSPPINRSCALQTCLSQRPHGFSLLLLSPTAALRRTAATEDAQNLLNQTLQLLLLLPLLVLFLLLLSLGRLLFGYCCRC